MGLKPVRISPDAYDALSKYHWPGNVRELENIISRGALKASSNDLSTEYIVLEPEDLWGGISMGELPGTIDLKQEIVALDNKLSLTEMTRNFQEKVIKSALEKNSGNWAAAARDLNMHRSNLHNLATRLGLRQKKT